MGAEVTVDISNLRFGDRVRLIATDDQIEPRTVAGRVFINGPIASWPHESSVGILDDDGGQWFVPYSEASAFEWIEPTQ